MACIKYSIQQQLCGRWPNVLMPVVRAAMREPDHRLLMRKLG